MCADKYGLALYPYLTGSKSKSTTSSSSSSSSTSHSEEIPYYADVEDYVRKRRGETPNHLEQYLAILYAKNPEKSRHLILEYYGSYLDKHGLDAKAGTDEALFSTSHWGHFGAARGPILYFALRNGDAEVVVCLTKVWQMMMSAASLLRTPKWEIVSPGARFFGNANQTKECNYTFQWLETGKIPRHPSTLETAPSWLGLYSVMLTTELAAKVLGRDIRTFWTGNGNYKKILPPLKNPLVVHKSESGHVAQFLTTEKMLMPAKWAYAEYKTGSIVYGVSGETYERVVRETQKNRQFPPKGIEVKVDKEAPQCPGRDVKEYRFPVAGRRHQQHPPTPERNLSK